MGVCAFGLSTAYYVSMLFTDDKTTSLYSVPMLSNLISASRRA